MNLGILQRIVDTTWTHFVCYDHLLYSIVFINLNLYIEILVTVQMPIAWDTLARVFNHKIERALSLWHNANTSTSIFLWWNTWNSSSSSWIRKFSLLAWKEEDWQVITLTHKYFSDVLFLNIFKILSGNDRKNLTKTNIN